MSEVECGYCWQRDNLSEAQRQDPANRITGTVDMCDRHRELFEGVLRKFDFVILDDPLPKQVLGKSDSVSAGQG